MGARSRCFVTRVVFGSRKTVSSCPPVSSRWARWRDWRYELGSLLRTCPLKPGQSSSSCRPQSRFVNNKEQHEHGGRQQIRRDFLVSPPARTIKPSVPMGQYSEALCRQSSKLHTPNVLAQPALWGCSGMRQRVKVLPDRCEIVIVSICRVSRLDTPEMGGTRQG